MVPRTIARRLVLLTALLVGAQAQAGGPMDVSAFYREGQTFLTWKEDGSVTGEWYRVYASDEPITAANLTRASFIARIPEGSREFGFLRHLGPKSRLRQMLERADWIKGIQLEDDDNASKTLPAGTGVFVRTIKKAGRSYYAVTVERDGREDTTIAAGVNSLTEPVDEAVETPGAIRLQKLGERYYVYLFFTDFETWNPDKTEDNREGYAHVFRIRWPKDGDLSKRLPLSVRLHAYSAWQDWNIPYCHPRSHVNLRLLDYHLTWWYGYSDALPKVEGGRYEPFPVKGTVVNFTEQRVLQAVRWLMKDPKNFIGRIDPKQISVYGGSMGGSGVNVFGARHGEIFAGGWGCKGITNWNLPREHNHWYPNIQRSVKPLSRNDPTNEGVPVYQVLDLPKWLGDHPEIETPFLDEANGIIDGVITFHSVPDYWRGLEKGKHPYAAGWDMVGHASTLGSGSPMGYLRMRLDESLPALANASCNTPLRSGFRIMSRAASLSETTLSIRAGRIKDAQGTTVKGGFPPNLAGKTLVLAPSHLARTWWTIKSNTPNTVTIEDGNLLDYEPPLTPWQLSVLKGRLKRDPTPDDLKKLRADKKLNFLICDGAPRGTWNGHFAWSSSRQDFDPRRKEDDIVDEADRWAVCLRLQKNKIAGEWQEATAAVDVTPRRVQRFKPDPGETVHWENYDCADPAAWKKSDEGDVRADRHGLVTVPRFVVGKKGWGNRLVLTRRK